MGDEGGMPRAHGWRTPSLQVGRHCPLTRSSKTEGGSKGEEACSPRCTINLHRVGPHRRAPSASLRCTVTSACYLARPPYVVHVVLGGLRELCLRVEIECVNQTFDGSTKVQIGRSPSRGQTQLETGNFTACRCTAHTSLPVHTIRQIQSNNGSESNSDVFIWPAAFPDSCR